MNGKRPGGEQIGRYIIENVEEHPNDIGKFVSEKFGITRQAVHRHLRHLIDEAVLTETGHTRSRSYALRFITEWNKVYYLTPDLAEDVAWRDDVSRAIEATGEVADIWQYGFTEMFNNAKDHSEGRRIFVNVRKTAAGTEMAIVDDGVGIFKKIQRDMGLLDERTAILELHKGKLTTDPDRHTGEGVFFTSRMFDAFQILSGGCFFNHREEAGQDWMLQSDKPEKQSSGTHIYMKLSSFATRKMKDVFDKYTSGEDSGFAKTVVPVELAQYGNDKLISRSQAKRVMARVEQFVTVVLDFQGVPIIGQPFADEIFRVFTMQHPHVDLLPINMVLDVEIMVKRALLFRSLGIDMAQPTPEDVQHLVKEKTSEEQGKENKG